MLSGWDAGLIVEVGSDDAVVGEPAVHGVGAAPLVAAARLARECHARLGDERVEWAFAAGDIVLLQACRSAASALPPPEPAVSGSADPLAIRMALGASRYPGRLGDELVLPWLAACAGSVDRPAGSPTGRPGADLDAACALAAELVETAWQGDDPEPTLRALRGSAEQAALQRLAALAPVNLDRARRVVTLLDGVAGAAVRAGLVPAPSAAWRFTADELRDYFRHGRPPAHPRSTGPERWEPYVHATVRVAGATVSGVAAAPGIGAGRVVYVDGPGSAPPLGGREVLVTSLPVPGLAPLLWGAAGLITTSGNPAAHLVEVARSLGVPAVVGARVTAASHGAVAAVDGHRGAVTILAEAPENYDLITCSA